jgi:hypothetical protein
MNPLLQSFLRRTLSLGIPLGVVMAASAPTMAATLELKVFPLNDPAVNCPDKIMAYETPRPYQEGSYTRDGMIQLQAIATNIQLTTTDVFSATWVGTLKPQYQACRASGTISNIDGMAYQGVSYLRVRLIDSKVYAILDMTGMPDVNNYNTVITYKGLQNGNPRWAWAGTD